jgi:predicted RecA/RadA family phage recombinase
MAANIIQTDGTYELKYTTTGAVSAGALIVSGKAVGVALESATGSGQVITVLCGCAATLTKKAAASSNVTLGGWISYTVTGGINAVRGSAATADDLIGYGLEVATTAATSAKVRLIRDPMRRIG